MTTTAVDMGRRWDDAFEALSQVLIAVKVPFEHEEVFEKTYRNLGLYSEQQESNDTHVTYYFRPNVSDNLIYAVMVSGLPYGTVTLPDTDRGREIYDGLSFDLRRSTLANNLIHHGGLL